MLLKQFIEHWREKLGIHAGMDEALWILMTNKFTLSRWLNRHHRPTGAHKTILLREGIELDQEGYVK